MSPCYVCDRVRQLSTRGRCVQCECNRSIANEKENERLREMLELTICDIQYQLLHHSNDTIEALSNRVADYQSFLKELPNGIENKT